ncbi:nucleotidyltransferase domain-containing protein [Halanaerobiaceae bacterium Z-7014]|uniref:Nucleotidyltransferase domain-containing protein n=1 Tax=Halonatronomonas betaini TaxID=2778430 RepID=A0A931ANG1_9FIRM|nr:nucleotidyltransferase domain-containing protein [Halonatronomonas betaini]MBF8435542.1 nucleotidyltransferase domain-containing protein [Halonatronomonas betaini]
MTELIDDLKAVKDYFVNLDDIENIQAAYLFGSHASGKANRLSDLDIAILLREEKNQSEIKLKVLKELTDLGYDNIDLVILNNLSIVAKYEVVKHNNLLYAAEDFEPNSYFSLTIRKYLDFKPYLKVQQKYLKEKILNDQDGQS